MRVYKTTDALPSGDTELLHIYNGLDCLVTLEVLQAIAPQLDEVTSQTYKLERDLQGPVFDMMCRGVLVDQTARSEVILDLEFQKARLEKDLARLLLEGLGVTCNPNSPAQLKTLLYKTLKLPPVRYKGKETTNREALEKLQKYFYAEPIIAYILEIRDLGKQLSVLRTGIDPDGRIRTSYNIAGTDTGRFASYASTFGSGTNLQNITNSLRRIYIADVGKKFCYLDLEQAESRAVGAIVWNLFQDGTYIDACESGDLHTLVCRLCWPHLAWTDDPAENKRIAKQSFYRHFDYRDAAKRLGHATNYYGKPPNIARQTHIEQALVAEFQRKYFNAFSGIEEWHKWCKNKLLRDGWITTFMGRRRWFFGRRWEDETLRAAIAYEPQSAVAEILNKGMLQVWRKHPEVQLLLQVHDAIVFQFDEEREDEIVPAIAEAVKIKIPLLHGRELIIPTEAKTGWNWATQKDNTGKIVNPDGLVTFNGADKRRRTETLGFMDRLLY